MDLASIHSFYDNYHALLAANITTGEKSWIGLIDRDTLEEYNFEWTDGTGDIADYSNWYPGEPNYHNEEIENCVEMYSGGNWNNRGCDDDDTNNRWVCKKYSGVDKSGYYGIYTEIAKNWSDSEQYCIDTYGTHLASIHNETENNKAWESVAINENGYIKAWIGFTDSAEEGIFQWSDGSDNNFTMWNTGEPNDIGGEDCVQFYLGNQWNDDGCSEKVNYFICNYNYNYNIASAAPTVEPSEFPSDVPSVYPTRFSTTYVPTNVNANTNTWVDHEVVNTTTINSATVNPIVSIRNTGAPTSNPIIETNNEESYERNLTTMIIIVTLCVCTVLLFLLCCVSFLLFRQKKQNQEMKEKKRNEKMITSNVNVHENQIIISTDHEQDENTNAKNANVNNNNNNNENINININVNAKEYRNININTKQNGSDININDNVQIINGDLMKNLVVMAIEDTPKQARGDSEEGFRNEIDTGRGRKDTNHLLEGEQLSGDSIAASVNLDTINDILSHDQQIKSELQQIQLYASNLTKGENTVGNMK